MSQFSVVNRPAGAVESSKLAAGRRRVNLIAAAITLGLLSPMAHAEVDITAITGAAGDIALVGGAVFALYVGMRLWKWVRGAL